MTITEPTAPALVGIDPRGQRFAAAVTALVLAATLVLSSPLLLALQAIAFALGAFAGPAAQPYGIVFRRAIRPRMAPPAELEDPRPPRFAQACGLALTLVGLVAFAFGPEVLALAAVAAAFGAAFLNAAFDFCIGCEIYLRVQRVRVR